MFLLLIVKNIAKVEIWIFKELIRFFFIDVDGVPCPAKNQDMLGNDIHTQIVGSWEECGEYLCTF